MCGGLSHRRSHFLRAAAAAASSALALRSRSARSAPARPPAHRPTHSHSGRLGVLPRAVLGLAGCAAAGSTGRAACPREAAGDCSLISGVRGSYYVPCARWYLRAPRARLLLHNHWLCGSEGERGGEEAKGNNPETFILDCAQAREGSSLVPPSQTRLFKSLHQQELV